LSSRGAKFFDVPVVSLFVREHQPPEVPGDAPFEAAHRFVAGLAVGDLAIEVATPMAVGHADWGDRNEVQRRVQAHARAEPPGCSAPEYDAVLPPVDDGQLDRFGYALE